MRLRTRRVPRLHSISILELRGCKCLVSALALPLTLESDSVWKARGIKKTPKTAPALRSYEGEESVW